MEKACSRHTQRQDVLHPPVLGNFRSAWGPDLLDGLLCPGMAAAVDSGQKSLHNRCNDKI